MPNNKYFCAEHDREIENIGGFWCHACLIGKPMIEQSPDPRYCQGCYEFLLEEAEMLGSGKRTQWVPRVPQKHIVEPVQPASGVGHNNTGTQIGSGIMSTLESKKFEVDIIHSPDAINDTAKGKRGPKYKPLPEELITQWASEGMGSKAIAAKLKDEPHITVSYKTIQRLLSGERKQLALPIPMD